MLAAQSAQPSCLANGSASSRGAVAEVLLQLANGIPPAASISYDCRASRDVAVPHAPFRSVVLTRDEKKLAIKNALRYFPQTDHAILAPEFLYELETYGHIYMYRFRPTFPMKAYPIDTYPAKCQHAAAIMLMIMNNLDPVVAQYPHEMITYGGNGSVFNNWAQFWLAMHYLSTMTETQTLVMASGHPAGLFPSRVEAPRVVVTNGMVVPNYSKREDYDKMYALGVSQYGQMTAGSYCYIGPQGIVHGTTITVLNFGRRYLNVEGLHGKVFVTAGLGGMSGAQAKAGMICGAVTVVAEVDAAALRKRHQQGWVSEVSEDLDSLVKRVREAKMKSEPVSIGFLGNVVDVWERFATEEEMLIDLGSDQTSLHNPFNGGYYPVGLSFEESQKMMRENPEAFKSAVQASLRRHVAAVNKLATRGMRFWDYGNSFMLEASRAGADILLPSGKFKYPSYVEDIMGDVFALGFGPFRWVCLSLDPSDLALTDSIASSVMRSLSSECTPERSIVKGHLDDNTKWVESAGMEKLVVGSQARILYANAEGRIRIALAFNEHVKSGRLKGPVILSRDHHDVSGTDSPWRETSDIRDGSQFCADMAVHNAIGDSFRGATSISLHNGGGTGWGEAINGGFLLVMDGTDAAAERARKMLHWDVNNGIVRRAWSGNSVAVEQTREAMSLESELRVTLPNVADDSTLDTLALS